MGWRDSMLEKSESQAIEFTSSLIPTGEAIIARAFAATKPKGGGPSSLPDFSNALGVGLAVGDLISAARTLAEAKALFITVTDRSVVICHRRYSGLGKWEHGLTLPRESVRVVKFKKGMLNTVLKLSAAGVEIDMLTGNWAPKASKYADLGVLNSALSA